MWQFEFDFSRQKYYVLQLTALAAVASAEPGWYGYPGVYNSPTLQWPGVSGPGYSSTLWGAPGYRGKRSAEPSAEPEPYYGYPYYGYYGLGYGRGVAGHAGGGFSYTQRSPQGIGKRSADEEPQALATHPSGGTSFVGQTVWGFPRSKRSAEPEPYYGFPYYGYGRYYGFGGVAAHPGFATSYTQRSPQGLRGKRSAEPYYGYLHQQAWPSVRAPGFSATTYGARPYGYYWG